MKPSEPIPTVAGPIPWATLVAVAAAILVSFWPAAALALEWDRLQILSGQWWRVVSGNWVHLSRNQLWWNVAVLLPAGIWAERVQPWRARALYLIAPLIVGGALFFLEPQLVRFGGLSGVATAFVVFLALAQLQGADTDRWFWRAVLALVALKIIAEVLLASRWLSHYSDPLVRSVALSHLAGVVAGVIVLGALRKRGKRRKD